MSHSSHHSKEQDLHCNVFGKISGLTLYSLNWIVTFHQLSSVMTYIKAQLIYRVLKRCCATPGSVQTYHRCEATKWHIVHTFLGNCSPASNSSASVITASNSILTECHSFGYIKSTPFGQQSFRSCLSTSQ